MGVAGKQICQILQFYWQRPDKPTNVSKFLMTSLKWQTPFPALPSSRVPSSLPQAHQLSCTRTNPSSYTICISCETTTTATTTSINGRYKCFPFVSVRRVLLFNFFATSTNSPWHPLSQICVSILPKPTGNLCESLIRHLETVKSNRIKCNSHTITTSVAFVDVFKAVSWRFWLDFLFGVH